jgi:hypothetical protein
LRGEMSLVGPRPCLPYEVEHFAPHHFERFLVPAGMTGLWRVTARAHSNFGRRWTWTCSTRAAGPRPRLEASPQNAASAAEVGGDLMSREEGRVARGEPAPVRGRCGWARILGAN